MVPSPNGPHILDHPEPCTLPGHPQPDPTGNRESMSQLTASEADESASQAFHRWRPRYHLIAPRGPMNDPCGMGYDADADIYHIGFQWNPLGTGVSWACATSKDLATWEVAETPSLAPSEDLNAKGVFTGCLSPVSLKPKTLTAFYTSARSFPIHHTVPYSWGSEALHIATSTDTGRTWRPDERCPILRGPPEGLEVTGWRDPFVSTWRTLADMLGDAPDTLYGIVSGGVRHRGPTIFLYRLGTGADIVKWTFLGTPVSLPCNFASSRWAHDFGANWEVTNFVSLRDEDGPGTHDFLITSVEGRKTNRYTEGFTAFRKERAQVWVGVKLDADNGVSKTTYQYGGFLDHGGFYAGSTFWDPKIRSQVLFGWAIEDGLSEALLKRQGWSGMLSLPRVLGLQRIKSVVSSLSSPLQDITSVSLEAESRIPETAQAYTVTTLSVMPHPALLSLRRNPQRVDAVTFAMGQFRGFEFPDGCATWELELSFDMQHGVKAAGIVILHTNDDNLQTTISFHRETETLGVARQGSSSRSDIEMPDETAPHTLFTTRDSESAQLEQELLTLRIFFDVSLLEIFANSRTALTTRVYSDSGTAFRIRPFVERGRREEDVASVGLLSCNFWEMGN